MVEEMVGTSSVMLTQGQIRDILIETGAFRKGHFLLPMGKHTNHYFQMPLALRYFNYARTLCVGLSRLLRVDPKVTSALPRCSVVGPASGGIPVAFGVREALNADQIFWVEREEGHLSFRQFAEVKPGDKCILVDDITFFGNTMQELVKLIQGSGGIILAIGVIVNPGLAGTEFGDIPFYSLIDIKTDLYDESNCPLCKQNVPLVKVRI
ncbi:MAG: phosphoribosyltransferase [Armatimonadetes bacterium]|nr:phosphoribosyltransferase [Armatimonadota bacterium]